MLVRLIPCYRDASYDVLYSAVDHVDSQFFLNVYGRRAWIFYSLDTATQYPSILKKVVRDLGLAKVRGLSIIRIYKAVMDLAIPISRFDPGRVKWGQPRDGPFRRIIPFGYEENPVNLSNLILVLHPLKIAEIDWSRSQIVLEDSNKLQFLSKLEQLQANVIQELEKNFTKWVDETKAPRVVKNPLQLWLKSKRITLYLSADPSTLSFHDTDGPSVFSQQNIKPGDIIRAVIKIQGVSLQMSEDDIWTGKSRIQHHILHLYKVASCVD